MKFQICLTFIFFIGIVCAQTVDDETAVLKDANEVKLTQIIDSMKGFVELFNIVIQTVPVPMFEPVIATMSNFANVLSSLQSETNTKTNEILSKLMKNGQVDPSQVVPATLRLAKLAINEFDQLEKLYLDNYKSYCTLMQSVSGTIFESFAKILTEYYEYIL